MSRGHFGRMILAAMGDEIECSNDNCKRKKFSVASAPKIFDAAGKETKNSKDALIFECPSCGTKTVHHEKKRALELFEQRRAANAKKKRKDNSELPAGSPMYYYCVCGVLTDSIGESDFTTVPKKICNDCKPLKAKGWI